MQTLLIVRRLIGITWLVCGDQQLEVLVEDPRILFGRRVRRLRNRLGWSQEQLALESGLDRTYVGGVERGERNIALLNIIRLANALRIPPARLLEFRGMEDGEHNR